MRGFILTLVLIAIFISAASSITLDEAVKIARQNNPQIKQAEKLWKAAQAEVTKGSTWPNPMLMGSYDGVPQVNGALEDAPMKMYGFSQTIPFPGKLTIKRMALLDMANMAREKYNAKTQEITSKVKATYYSLYFVNKAIEINEENKALLKKFAKIAEVKYVVGRATHHDVLKARIELSLLDNNLITLEQKKQTAVLKFNTLLNRNPNASVDLGEPKIGKLSLTPDQLEKTALSNRPELVAMYYALKSKEKRALLSGLDFLPNFDLRVLQKEMKATGRAGWNTRIMASVPLWFWKQTASAHKASSEKGGAAAGYENMYNMVRLEVQDAYYKVDAAQRTLKLFDNRIVPQAKQMVKAATRAYEGNKIDFLSLINSQKNLENAKLKYYKAFTDLGKNLAELERVVGKTLEKEEI